MKLDLRAVLLAVWLPALAWLLCVGGATAAGYPGVVCVTPVGWLLGLNAGQRCAMNSASKTDRERLVEAGLSGMLLGGLQGVLFSAVLFLGTPMGLPGGSLLDAVGVAIISLLAVGMGSMLACVLLATGMAAIVLKRQKIEQPPGA